MAVPASPHAADDPTGVREDRDAFPTVRMWLLFFWLGVLLGGILGRPHPAEAQPSSRLAGADSVLSIQTARADRDGDDLPDRRGDTVTVAGRALLDAGQLVNERIQLSLQDGQAAIALRRLPDSASVQAGDSLVVRGIVGQDNGLTQLNVRSYRVVDAPSWTPPVAPASVEQAASEAFEGRLVEVKGLVVNRGTNAGGQYLVISDQEQSGSTLTLFVSNPRAGTLPLDGYETGDIVRVTGLVGQYDFDPPYDAYYQIYPRTAEDVAAVGLTQRHYRYLLFGGGLLSLLALGGVFVLRRQVRKRTQELAESEARMRAIFEGAAPGIAILDTDRTLRTANPALAQILDRDADALRDAPLDAFLHDDEVHAVRRACRQVLSGQRDAHQGEHRFVTLDGETVWGQVSLSLLPTPQREDKAHVVMFVVDVTERNRLETQLRRAQKMETVGTLAGGVAHDFNNILHAALAYVRMGMQDLPEEGAAHDFLGRAITGLERAEELVDQLLAFSRKESPSPSQHVNLAEVLQESIDLVAPSVPDEVTLRTALDDDCAILGDPSQIRQVATNLLTNALQAMRDAPSGEAGHTLDVRVRESEVDEKGDPPSADLAPGAYVRLIVSDTGPGMAPSTKERVFEPFFTTKPVNEGTGLGLAVVHGIVESHDGAITVHTQVGEGTTFNVYFPKPDSTAPADAARTADNGSHHILLIENDAEARERAAARLHQAGFAVTVCTSAPEAFTTVSTDTFDVVVTDHVTPNVNGLELAEALRHQGHDMPIVLLSGFSAQVSDADLQRAGIEHLLRKPVSLAELESVLEKITN